MQRSSHAGAYFDRRAARYDDAYDAPGPDGHALRSRLAAVLQLVGSGPGDALDAGMGPGRLLAELAGRGWTVSGLDASAEMVDVARRRRPEAAERLVVGEIEQLPFPDTSFDLVVATGVLEYAQVDRALAELARVLRPGGTAVVSYPNPAAVYGIWKSHVWYRSVRLAKRLGGRSRLAMPHGSKIVGADRFRGWLEHVGLEPQTTVYTGFLVLPSPLDSGLPGLSERLAQRLERTQQRRRRRLGTQIVYSATRRGD